MDYSYVNILTVDFSAVGYKLNYDEFRYSLSWIFYIFSLATVRQRMLLISDYFFITILFGVTAPLLIIWGLDYERSSTPVVANVFSILIIYLLVRFRSGFKVGFDFYFKDGFTVAIVISLLLTFYLVFWYPISGVRFNLDFSKVYEFRDMNSELSSPGFLAYLNTWVYKIFACFALSYFLLKKRYTLVVLIVSIFIFYFGANSHKSVLFTPLLIISMWLYFRKYNSIVAIPIGFSLIVLLSNASYYYFDDIWLSALFPNRVFLIPAHLTFKYFEFFEVNEYVFFSNSFLKYFLEYPYNLNLNDLIGEYDNKPGAAANNGYLSSAFAQGGLVVIFLYSIVIAFILRFFDGFIKNGLLPLWFLLSITAVPIRDFSISIDLLTTLLTGGLFVLILILFLIRKRPVLFKKGYTS